MSGVSIALFAAVASVAIVGFRVLIHESRVGRGAGLFVLSALPLALLFVIAPVPVAAFQSIQAFQAIAATGRSDDAARVLALGIARPLWPGLVGCLLVLCVAAVLQVRATRSDAPAVRGVLSVDDAPDAGAAPSSAGKPWGNWILVASALLAIPVGILHYLTTDIATLIVHAGRAVTSANAGTQTAVVSRTLSEFSALLSARLLLATLGGFALTFFVLVFAIFNLVVVRYTARSNLLEKFSWAVFAIVAIAAAWNVVRITVSMRSF